jgi:AcrR family transcriptional regulator
MQKQSSSETAPSVLDPTTPTDIAGRSQRRRIIDAMVASCAEKTYPATTITDIVSRASISRTTFYKQFADKRACFDAALEDCIEELRAVARASVSDSDSPPEAVRKGSAAMLDRLAARPELGQLLVAEAVAVDPSAPARYRGLLIPALKGLLGSARTRRGGTSPGLAFGRAQLLVFNQLAAGRPERLSELQPEIVYLALAPFVGHREALEQARPVARPTRTDELAPR